MSVLAVASVSLIRYAARLNADLAQNATWTSAANATLAQIHEDLGLIEPPEANGFRRRRSTWQDGTPTVHAGDAAAPLVIIRSPDNEITTRYPAITYRFDASTGRLFRSVDGEAQVLLGDVEEFSSEIDVSGRVLDVRLTAASGSRNIFRSYLLP